MTELRWRGVACLLALLALLGNSMSASSATQPVGPVTVAERIASREFPSIFQPWGPADNLLDESPIDTEARHDLLWNLPEFFALRWNTPYRLPADWFLDWPVETARTTR